MIRGSVIALPQDTSSLWPIPTLVNATAMPPHELPMPLPQRPKLTRKRLPIKRQRRAEVTVLENSTTSGQAQRLPNPWPSSLSAGWLGDLIPPTERMLAAQWQPNGDVIKLRTNSTKA